MAATAAKDGVTVAGLGEQRLDQVEDSPTDCVDCAKRAPAYESEGLLQALLKLQHVQSQLRGASQLPQPLIHRLRLHWTVS